MSRGKLDKLERAVYKKRDNNVPRELWTNAEIMFEAYYINNGSCGSVIGPTIGNFQVMRKRKAHELPT